MAITPLVTVHTCRSWTDVTPGIDAMRSWTSSSAMPAGVASSRMSVLSFTSRQAPARMSSEMKTEMSGSAGSQPVARMMAPAASAPAEPSASLRMWRYAPRWLSECSCPWCKTPAPITFATSPAAATPSSSPASIWGGFRNRWYASTATPTEIAIRAAPFTSAARISSRSRPNVRSAVAGRCAREATTSDRASAPTSASM